MTERVFTAEHLEGQFEAIKLEQDRAALILENAVLRATIVRVLEAGGHALHAIFVSGDEVKWRHPSQREALIDLSNALRSAHSHISKGAA